MSPNSNDFYNNIESRKVSLTRVKVIDILIHDLDDGTWVETSKRSPTRS
jgi:hypothetical protein